MFFIITLVSFVFGFLGCLWLYKDCILSKDWTELRENSNDLPPPDVNVLLYSTVSGEYIIAHIDDNKLLYSNGKQIGWPMLPTFWQHLSDFY